jgi:hypothetical protein
MGGGRSELVLSLPKETGPTEAKYCVSQVWLRITAEIAESAEMKMDNASALSAFSAVHSISSSNL